MKKKFMILATMMVVLVSGCGKTDKVSYVEEDTEVIEERMSTEYKIDELSNNVVGVQTENEQVEEELIEESDVPEYTYLDMEKMMYAKSSVNVRNLPCTDGEVNTTLSMNEEVKVTGQCNETGWYRIEKNNEELYVSNNYLSDEKTEIQDKPAKESQEASDNNTSAGSTNSEKTSSDSWLQSKIGGAYGRNTLLRDATGPYERYAYCHLDWDTGMNYGWEISYDCYAAINALTSTDDEYHNQAMAYINMYGALDSGSHQLHQEKGYIFDEEFTFWV